MSFDFFLHEFYGRAERFVRRYARTHTQTALSLSMAGDTYIKIYKSLEVITLAAARAYFEERYRESACVHFVWEESEKSR